MATRAVLDACVLYPVSLRDVLLRCVEAGLFQIVWSSRILEEMKGAILANRPDIKESRLDTMIEQMRSAFPEAEVDGWETLEEAMTNEAKDRHVLAVAVRARADMVVTSNLKHFPEEACEPYCVEPIGPDDFLCQLLEINEQSMKGILEQLSLDKRNPPQTVREVLDAISRSAPTFAQLARGIF